MSVFLIDKESRPSIGDFPQSRYMLSMHLACSKGAFQHSSACHQTKISRTLTASYKHYSPFTTSILNYLMKHKSSHFLTLQVVMTIKPVDKEKMSTFWWTWN